MKTEFPILEPIRGHSDDHSYDSRNDSNQNPRKEPTRDHSPITRLSKLGDPRGTSNSDRDSNNMNPSYYLAFLLKETIHIGVMMRESDNILHQATCIVL